MHEQESAVQRLEEDRKHLLYKLDCIGYVPDVDMRDALAIIRSELQKRIRTKMGVKQE